MRHLPLLGKAV